VQAGDPTFDRSADRDLRPVGLPHYLIRIYLRFRMEENHAVSGDSCHGAQRSLIDLMHRCRVNRGQDQKHGADDEGCRWDYDELERWTRVGFERGMRLGKGER
jgi:hypothetical protein